MLRFTVFSGFNSSLEKFLSIALNASFLLARGICPEMAFALSKSPLTPYNIDLVAISLTSSADASPDVTLMTSSVFVSR